MAGETKVDRRVEEVVGVGDTRRRDSAPLPISLPLTKIERNKIYQARYRSKNKERCNLATKLSRSNPISKEKAREYRNAWRNKNPEKYKSLRLKHYYKHHENEILKSRLRRRENKELIIAHYSKSSSCAICGFTDIRALTIDHINGGGSKHRKLICRGGGNVFYVWLKKNNYPEGFQVLCMNCQFIKRDINGECSHNGRPKVNATSN